jgi:hypothetical protein
VITFSWLLPCFSFIIKYFIQKIPHKMFLFFMQRY